MSLQELIVSHAKKAVRFLVPVTAATMFSVAMVITVLDHNVEIRYHPGDPVDITYLGTNRTEGPLIGERNVPQPSEAPRNGAN